MFMAVFQRLWVLKGRTDAMNGSIDLKRGPWHCKYVGFGVHQAARSPRFQMNDGVL